MKNLRAQFQSYQSLSAPFAGVAPTGTPSRRRVDHPKRRPPPTRVERRRSAEQLSRNRRSSRPDGHENRNRTSTQRRQDIVGFPPGQSGECDFLLSLSTACTHLRSLVSATRAEVCQGCPSRAKRAMNTSIALRPPRPEANVPPPRGTGSAPSAPSRWGRLSVHLSALRASGRGRPSRASMAKLGYH